MNFSTALIEIIVLIIVLLISFSFSGFGLYNIFIARDSKQKETGTELLIWGFCIFMGLIVYSLITIEKFGFFTYDGTIDSVEKTTPKNSNPIEEPDKPKVENKSKRPDMKQIKDEHKKQLDNF